MKRSCLRCKFFRKAAEQSQGLCHRYPPQALGLRLAAGGDKTDPFPVVLLFDWCGEFVWSDYQDIKEEEAR